MRLPLICGSAAFAALAVTLALAPIAFGDETPEELAETIAEAAEVCRKGGGTPEIADVLRSEDLSGDGRPDWIADYAKLGCKGGANPACNPNGCLLQLYYWTGVGWDKMFEDFVKSYKFSTSGKARIMHVTTSHIPCNKPKDEACAYNYRLGEDAITPVR